MQSHSRFEGTGKNAGQLASQARGETNNMLHLTLNHLTVMATQGCSLYQHMKSKGQRGSL